MIGMGGGGGGGSSGGVAGGGLSSKDYFSGSSPSSSSSSFRPPAATSPGGSRLAGLSSSDYFSGKTSTSGGGQSSWGSFASNRGPGAVTKTEPYKPSALHHTAPACSRPLMHLYLLSSPLHFCPRFLILQHSLQPLLWPSWRVLGLPLLELPILGSLLLPWQFRPHCWICH